NQAFSGSYLYNRASAASMLVFLIIVVLSVALFLLMRDRDEVKLRRQERALKRRGGVA
ncbi:MAG: sugar ABC transporter permease, partial [Spirochaetales bacterium]|nr:sugar ABC transporter permease [Spirochaetales bacterium]